MSSLYYTTCHTLLRGLLPLALTVEMRGIEHIPAQGPCLLVGNHLSYVDPVCLVASMPRRFHGMAKAELFENPLMNMFLSGFDPIKVHRRGIDRQALSLAEAYLKQGKVVMVYAEGTRSKTGEVQEAHAGVVFLAQRTGVPIVPVATSGTDRVFRKHFPWYHRSHVRLMFGEAFHLADLGEVTRHNRHQLAQEVMARVAALLPPAYQGVYGSNPPPPPGRTVR